MQWAGTTVPYLLPSLYNQKRLPNMVQMHMYYTRNHFHIIQFISPKLECSLPCESGKSVDSLDPLSDHCWTFYWSWSPCWPVPADNASSLPKKWKMWNAQNERHFLKQNESVNRIPWASSCAYCPPLWRLEVAESSPDLPAEIPDSDTSPQLLRA